MCLPNTVAQAALPGAATLSHRMCLHDLCVHPAPARGPERLRLLFYLKANSWFTGRNIKYKLYGLGRQECRLPHKDTE